MLEDRFISLMCMNVLSANMYVHHVHVWYLRKSEESFRHPGTRVIDSCEPPCGFWELSPGPLQE
ncbi:hypothetical protein STEG23_011297 [Scotinomys teguina]